MAEVVRRVVDELQGRDLAPDPESAVGIDFPAVVKNGMVVLRSERGRLLD